MKSKPALRIALFCLGWLSLGLGVAGAFLPLLPTTPFLLLAAFCFSKSSPRWHAWLLRQPLLGPAIQDWQNHGTISLRAKCLATLFMTTGLFFLLQKAPPFALAALVGVVMGGILIFLWSRPSKRIC